MQARGPRGRWAKGSSGNPRGVAKQTAGQLEVKDIARGHGPNIIERLAKIALFSEDEQAATRAGELVLAYGYGRPKQEVEAKVDHHVVDSVEELNRRLGPVPAGIGAGILAAVEEPS